ncbi:glycosyltransferase family 4 protein [Gloeobacter kilaueensis]|uniref:Glycosyl transferase group 1 n=1 Tax=Gloeobacter kilaueensis (strain ATCC BAA-2537 / CCAP 1431/1 / ULC 316 / JS1) TaxID=1183438 RepID=U5QFD3_GLOK1|nr:glycosyltransferase family 4 protein [Gloeobacter kilaueensis]AGY56304.1 glycosyl transferase group 1 [Gloeobacter kilaueensis JS1]
MHIAWLGKKTPFCGNVTYSREVTNGLMELGHRVSFLHFVPEEEGLPARIEQDEVPLPCLYKSQVYTIPSLRARKVLVESLRELKPDLVHASLSLSTLDFALPEICEELGLPLVATFHPAFDRRRRNFAANTQYLMYQWYASTLANYDRVIIFSQAQKDLLIRLGVPERRIAVIPNGVDTSRYSPSYSRIKADLRAKRLFVYMGRLTIEKNVEQLLKAWKQAGMALLGARLAIIGDGPLKSNLQGFYGLEEGVRWLGFVASEQRRIEILRGADVFVLPSLVEGLSISLLEAMACGTACVATDVGADGEVLSGGAGILVNPLRVRSELRTLLPVLSEQPEFTALLGQKARARVIERYTLSANIRALERLYSEVLKRAPAWL